MRCPLDNGYALLRCFNAPSQRADVLPLTVDGLTDPETVASAGDVLARVRPVIW